MIVKEPVLSLSKEKDSLETSSKRTDGIVKNSREFAKRIIMDGIMPLETVSRLSGLDAAAVKELAANIIALSSKSGGLYPPNS